MTAIMKDDTQLFKQFQSGMLTALPDNTFTVSNATCPESVFGIHFQDPPITSVR